MVGFVLIVMGVICLACVAGGVICVVSMGRAMLRRDTMIRWCFDAALTPGEQQLERQRIERESAWERTPARGGFRYDPMTEAGRSPVSEYSEEFSVNGGMGAN